MNYFEKLQAHIVEVPGVEIVHTEINRHDLANPDSRTAESVRIFAATVPPVTSTLELNQKYREIVPPFFKEKIDEDELPLRTCRAAHVLKATLSVPNFEMRERVGTDRIVTTRQLDLDPPRDVILFEEEKPITRYTRTILMPDVDLVPVMKDRSLDGHVPFTMFEKLGIEFEL